MVLKLIVDCMLIVCVEGRIKESESESESEDDVEVNDPYRYFTQMEDEDLVNLWPKGRNHSSS